MMQAPFPVGIAFPDVSLFSTLPFWIPPLCEDRLLNLMRPAGSVLNPSNLAVCPSVVSSPENRVPLPLRSPMVGKSFLRRIVGLFVSARVYFDQPRAPPGRARPCYLFCGVVTGRFFPPFEERSTLRFSGSAFRRASRSLLFRDSHRSATPAQNGLSGRDSSFPSLCSSFASYENCTRRRMVRGSVFRGSYCDVSRTLRFPGRSCTSFGLLVFSVRALCDFLGVP